MAGIIKLKASSLMEVLVAITMLMTVVILGTVIFINVTHSSYTGDKVRAQLIMDKIAKETILSQSYVDEEINEDNLIIRKKVVPYDGNTHLQILSLEIYNSENSLLAEKKKILLVKQ